MIKTTNTCYIEKKGGNDLGNMIPQLAKLTILIYLQYDYLVPYDFETNLANIACSWQGWASKYRCKLG